MNTEDIRKIQKQAIAEAIYRRMAQSGDSIMDSMLAHSMAARAMKAIEKDLQYAEEIARIAREREFANAEKDGE